MSVCELCQGCKDSKCTKENKVSVEDLVLPDVTNAFLILTERCNLACKYCFVSQNPREMTFETALQSAKFVIKNAEESGINPSVCFFGGEPMLKYDEIIVPIVDYIRNEYGKPCTINMTTNGTLLTEDRLKFLKDNGVTFLLSFDGNECAQNTNRVYHNGRGCFNDVDLELIVKYFPNITIRGTFDTNTVEYLSDSIKYVLSKGYKSCFFYPNVTGKWTDESIREFRKQSRIFSDYYIEQARRGSIVTHMPLDTKIKEVLKLNRYIDNNLEYKNTGKQAIIEKCGIGINNCCSVSTCGDIYGCQEMPSNYMDGEDNIFMFGNVYTGIDFDKRKKLISAYDPQEIDGEEYGGCDNCRLKRICNSGCSATNYRHSGSFSKPARMFCEYHNILFEEAEYIIKVLGEEKNEQFRNEYFVKSKSKGGVVYAE